MRPNTSFRAPTGRALSLAVLVLAALVGTPLCLQANLLRGQVTEIGTGKPIAGARVALYSDPMGTPDFTLITGPVGLYETADPVGGTTYEARVSRAGYLTSITSFMVDSDPDIANFELVPSTPSPGGGDSTGGLEVHVQVYGATTQIELFDCPINWHRFADQNADTPVASGTTILTDLDGYGVFLGLEPGFYEFEVNLGAGKLPGWHSVGKPVGATVTAPVRYHITTHAALGVQLKPTESSLTIHVKGFDFVKNTDMEEDLSDILVEIVAVDPFDYDRHLMPPINDVTDDDMPSNPSDGLVDFGAGKVVFNKLPPVSYRVTVKEIGYFEHVEFIDPLEDGTLPSDPQLIVLQPEENLLLVSPVFPGYKSNNELPFAEPDGISGLGLEVNVIGIDGTSTEGIKRRNFVKEFPPFDHGIAAFTEPYFEFGGPFGQIPVIPGPSFLKPGRYKVVISGYIEERVDWSHPAGSTFDNRVSFGVQHEEIVEIHPLGPEFEGTLGAIIPHTTTVPISPLTLTGRLFKADSTDEVRGEPVYAPFAGKTIEFVQPHGLGVLLDDPVFTTTTAEDGSYSIELPPGIFALNVLGATGYTGGRVEKTIIYSADPFRVGQTTSENPLFSDRWPFAGPWPDASGNTDKLKHYFNGNGLAINGHDISTLDLFLHKNVINVETDILEDAASPTRTRIVDIDTSTGVAYVTYPYSRLQSSGGTIDFVPEGGGAARSTPVRVKRPTEDSGAVFSQRIFARWNDVPPGTYSRAFSNAAYTVISIPEVSVWYPDFPLPGGVPDAATAAMLAALPFGERAPRALDRVHTGTLIVKENSVNPDITYERHNPGEDEYEPADGSHLIHFIELSGAGPSGQSGFFLSNTLPAAEGHVWLHDAGPNGWWRIPHNGTLKLDGPMRTPYTDLPAFSFDILVHAISIEDDNEEIAGVRLKRGETVQTTGPSGTLFLNQNGTGDITLDPGQNWRDQPQNKDVLPKFISQAGAETTLEQNFYVELGLEIRATVSHKTTADRIANAPVVVYNRYGAFQKAAKTTADGTVKIMALPGYQDYFVEVRVPGFKPLRKAFRTAMLDDDNGQPFYNAEMDLEPLEQPTITTSTYPFNRRGTFLPGVTRSKDGDTFDLFSAEDTLTADWTLMVSPATVSYSVPGFDKPDGSPGTAISRTFSDPPRTVYLVDRRTFPELGGQGQQEMATPVAVPEASDPQLMRTFLQDLLIKKGHDPVPKVYAKVSRELTGTSPVTATGKLKVWELPTGVFQPAFIVETSLGAYQRFLVPTETGDDVLNGVELPEWLGFALDLLGVSSGVAATQDELAKYVPDGDLIPFPDFSATISAVDDPMGGGDAKYLDYEYTLSVSGRVGQNGPGGGVASVLPGLIGADVKGTATIRSKGKEQNLQLELTGEAEQEFSGEKFTPAIARTLIGGDKDDLDIKATGAGTLITTASKNVNPGDRYNVRLTSTRGCSLRVDAAINLTPVTSKIPYAGPVIKALDKAGKLINRADLDASISVTTHNCFETLKPTPPQKAGSSTTFDPDPRNHRRHFLGGQFCESDGTITYGMTAGMKLVLGLNAGYGFGLEGSGRIGLDNFSFTVGNNQFGDFPVLKRVGGSVTITAEGIIKTPIKNFVRTYKWTALKFDAQYGTETVVSLTPLEIVELTQSIALSGPSVPFTMAPQLIKNVSALSWFDVSLSAPDVLLYPSFNAETGKVDLLLHNRTAGLTWGAGALVASVDEMGPNCLLRLPDGRLLITWMQPTGGASLDPFAPMTVKYVLGNATDTVFSAPASLFTTSAGLASCELHLSGSSVALFVVEQSGGYGSQDHELSAFTFDSDTDTWSAAIPLDTKLGGYRQLEILSSGAGGPGEFGIASLDETGDLFFARWDGASPTPTQTLVDSDLAGGLAGSFGPAGHTVVAVGLDSALVRYDRAAGAGMPITGPVTIGRGVFSIESTLTPRPSGGFLYLYTSLTGGGSEIKSVAFDATNTLVGESPTSITGNTVGEYHQLRPVNLADGTTLLFARYSGASNHEIRVFSLTEDLSLAANDSDGDNLNDIFELLIVDGDESDGIGMINAVSGADDFDGDGVSNADEATHGSDPADHTSAPSRPAALETWLTDRGYAPFTDLDIDADGNGWTLGEEFAFGFEPGAASGNRHPVLDEFGPNLRYRYTRRAGLTHTLQRSNSSLSQWSDITPLSTTILATNADGTEDVEILFSPDEAPYFIRVAADLIP